VLITALYLLGRGVLGQLSHTYTPTVLRVINVFMVFGLFVLAKDAMEGALKLLYEAPETSLLLSLPLSPLTIFGFKLAELIASNLLSMVVWLVPPWTAFGQFFHLPWHFFLALIPACFCLHLIIISQVTIGLMIIVRFFSSRWLIRALKIVGTVIGMSAGFLLSMSFLVLDQTEQIAHFLLNRVHIPTSDWYPHIWTANLMMGWLPDSDIELWRWGGQLVGGSIGVPILAMLLASRVYLRSWECAKRVEVTPKRKLHKSDRFSPLGRGKVRSMIAKDFLVFIRHRGRLAMFIMLTLILLVTLIVSTYGVREDGFSRQSSDAPLLRLGIQAMLYSVMVTLGLTWGGFKSEGQTWWLLKSSPISPNLLFHSKFLIATFCAVIYAEFWVVLGLIFFQVWLQLWLPTLCATALITVTATGVNTAIGTLPWVAEIETTIYASEKRPVFRIATMVGGVIANAAIVIAPAMVFELFVLQGAPVDISSRVSPLTIYALVCTTTLVFLVCVWGASYLIGRRTLRRLMA